MTKEHSKTGDPAVGSTRLLAAERELAWGAVIKLCAEYPDRNAKACIVQSAIAEFGPVPNSMGDLVRAALSANVAGERPETTPK